MLRSFDTNPELAIVCDQIAKKFYYTPHRIQSVREAFIRAIRRQLPEKRDPIFALEPFDMTVRRGEVVALIGPNGSGKSTALRLLAGIYAPTSGQIKLRGRSAAVIELGAGFNNELPGKANIQLYGTLMGMGRAVIRERYNEIVEFADIGPYINAPVKMYSSGMRARLAFAVTICLQPDILFLDEVLSVGDLGFRKKCAQRLHSFIDKGGTLVMATHDLEDIRRFASHVIWFEHGRVLMEGPTEQVLKEYTAPDVEEGEA